MPGISTCCHIQCTTCSESCCLVLFWLASGCRLPAGAVQQAAQDVKQVLADQVQRTEGAASQAGEVTQQQAQGLKAQLGQIKSLLGF